MFKLSFDLPEPKQEKDKLKNRKERKAEQVGADDLQNMFRELGRSDPAPAKRPAESEPKKRALEEPEQPAKRAKEDKKSKKDKKKAKAKEQTSAEAVPVRADPVEPKPKETKPEETKPKASAPETKQRKLTPMQLKMQQKLSGGRFRWINEQLYTVPSKQALELFTKSPDLFNEYHTGFRHQVESWPENPVDTMISDLKQRLQKPLNAPGGLPADKDGRVVIADMGCGEAELSRQVSRLKGSNKSKKVKFQIHSFDLHKANDRITVADIANVPLEDSSVHLVVYCLALMGTNTEDFIREALRVLKPFGEVWISEIKSRFDVVNNKPETDRFINKLKSYGLHFKSVDDSNKMFVSFKFVNLPNKQKVDIEEDDKPLLKPCIYKKR